MLDTTAEHYRAKAGVLRHMADSEVSEQLRVQLTDLASQYERLAVSLETPGSPERQTSD